jgi:hypothetical protein
MERVLGVLRTFRDSRRTTFSALDVHAEAPDLSLQQVVDGLRYLALNPVVTPNVAGGHVRIEHVRVA